MVGIGAPKVAITIVKIVGGANRWPHGVVLYTTGISSGPQQFSVLHELFSWHPFEHIFSVGLRTF